MSSGTDARLADRLPGLGALGFLEGVDEWLGIV
jgi:hypothetical protein